MRAGQLLNPSASFALAREFRTKGLPLADAFTFASGLYFRGKITYARHFAASYERASVRVITTNAGLLDPDTLLTPDLLRAFGTADINETDPRYLLPLRRDAAGLAAKLERGGTVVLLGSIATPKYREVLVECFGPQLVFPNDFVGRGDMSRGALLLRAVRENRELLYVPVVDAVLTGRRAPRIADMRPRPTRA